MIEQEYMDYLKKSVKEDMPLILEGNDPFKVLYPRNCKKLGMAFGRIIEAVSAATGIHKNHICGTSKKQHHAYARFLFLLFAAKHSGRSRAAMGAFINRQPSTVTQALAAAEKLLMQSQHETVRCESFELLDAYRAIEDTLNV